MKFVVIAITSVFLLFATVGIAKIVIEDWLFDRAGVSWRKILKGSSVPGGNDEQLAAPSIPKSVEGKS